MWGIMRACGRQATVAIVGFLCYWVLGLPLGITLALVVGLNAKGMWIGFSVAGGVQVGKISPFQHSATRVLSRKFCLEEGRGKFGQIHTVSKYTKIQTKNDLLLKISENN